MGKKWGALGFAVCCLWGAGGGAMAADVKSPLPFGIGTTFTFVTEPAMTSECSLKEDQRTARMFVADRYRLTLIRQDWQGNLIFTFRLERTDGAAFRLRSYQASLASPLSGREVVFTPNISPTGAEELIRCRPPLSRMTWRQIAACLMHRRRPRGAPMGLASEECQVTGGE